MRRRIDTSAYEPTAEERAQAKTEAMNGLADALLLVEELPRTMSFDPSAKALLAIYLATTIHHRARILAEERPQSEEEIANFEARLAKEDEEMAAIRRLAENMADMRNDVARVCREFGVKIPR